MYWNYMANIIVKTKEAGFYDPTNHPGSLNILPQAIKDGWSQVWKLDAEKLKKYSEYKFTEGYLNSIKFSMPNYGVQSAQTHLRVSTPNTTIAIYQIYGCCGMVSCYISTEDLKSVDVELLKALCAGMGYSVIHYTVTAHQSQKYNKLKKAGFMHLAEADAENKRTGNTLYQLICHV